MATIKALAIAPYAGLRTLLEQRAVNFPDLALTVLEGNWKHGVKLAHQALEQEHYDILLSRGGTAQLMEHTLGIPVVSIDVSGYDYLRLIKMVSRFGEKAAIVGFPQITAGAEVICELLHSDIRIVTLGEEKDAKAAVQKLRDQGCSVIIGDVITVEAAQQAGVNGILLTSGAESVDKALSDACWASSILGKNSRDLSVLRSITDLNHNYITAYSASGELIYTNTKFCSSRKVPSMFKNAPNGEFIYTGENNEVAKLPDLTRFIPEVLERSHLEATLQDGIYMWRIQGNRIQDSNAKPYVIFYFSNHKVDDRHIPHGIQMVPMEAIASNPFIPLNGGKTIQNVVEQAKIFARTDLSILMCGQKGSGMDSLAYLIHQNSELAGRPFITAEAELLNHEDFDLVERQALKYSQTNNCFTLYLRHVDAFDLVWQRKLYSFLSSYANTTNIRVDNIPSLNTGHIRLIASCSTSLRALVKVGQFNHVLYRLLSGAELSVPSLSQRREDIPILASLFINQFSLSYGKQTIGFEPEALDYLQNFPYHYTIFDLKRLINRLLITNGNEPFFSLEQTKRYTEEMIQVQNTGCYILPKDKDLDTITREIIEQVLSEEGFNQSKAAKRLGISRSTMWRKMK